MKKWWLVLGAGLGLALLQQQLLLRRPPRLLAIEAIAPGRNSGALSIRFSRLMDGESLRRGLQLKPQVAHQLLGNGNNYTLLIQATGPIKQPFELQLKGKDIRGVQLKQSRWLWELRPTLLAARPVVGGDQIQRWHKNSWQPLSPVRGLIQSFLPLGNGRGVAVVNNLKAMDSQVWVLMLSAQGTPLREKQINKNPLIFAALSSDNKGDLLVQSSNAKEPGSRVELSRFEAADLQQPQRLAVEASGPIQLVPQGHQLVVPQLDGLSLQSLPPLPAKKELLPGSRDLSSFCPQPGRALLVRHWPDYRRSLELLEPGKAPKQIWLGSEALLATACAGGGERIWLLLLSGIRKPLLELIELNKQGKLMHRLPLTGRELDPGSKLHYDSTRQVLLLLLKRQSSDYQKSLPAQVHLIEVNNYSMKAIPGAATHSGWLPSRQLQHLNNQHPRK